MQNPEFLSMFDSITDKFQEALRHLRGQTTITESNVAEAMKSVREALIDADVNLEIADSFVEEVRTACLGEAVVKSVTPGQQAVKIVHDKLVELMGSEQSALNSGASPNVIMMVGLHGSGKTTTSAKLARYLKNQGKSVMLAACDVYRPAAIDQLRVLGGSIGVRVYSEDGVGDVPAIALRALNEARIAKSDYLIIDTAGRLQIDTVMVQELVTVSQVTSAGEIMLVADAALGQQAVSVARHFNDALHLTGIILTKLDGDARGGAALSIRRVTGCPVKFTGTGEKMEDLELFYPDRMASRILGMGDVISLVERAVEKIDRDEAEKLEEKMRRNAFDFDDFLSQLRQMSRLGGMETILKFLPGGNKLGDLAELAPAKFKGMEAIICSMTKQERANAEIIDMPRRRRIAAGSGRKVEEVSQLIKQFLMMKKVMKNHGLMNRLAGSVGALGSMGGFGGMGGGFGGSAMSGFSGGLGGFGGMRSGFGFRGSNNTVSQKDKRKKRHK